MDENETEVEREKNGQTWALPDIPSSNCTKTLKLCNSESLNTI